jgi:hypothetical protein
MLRGLWELVMLLIVRSPLLSMLLDCCEGCNNFYVTSCSIDKSILRACSLVVEATRPTVVLCRRGLAGRPYCMDCGSVQ